MDAKVESWVKGQIWVQKYVGMMATTAEFVHWMDRQ